MPENAAPQHVLTEREHAQLASELTCKADAREREMREVPMTPTGVAETQQLVENLRAAATAHALTAIALELAYRPDGTGFTFSGTPSDG